MKEKQPNTEQLLKAAEEKETARLAVILKHLQVGVFFVDIRAAYIDPEVVIGGGTLIEPGVMLQGKTVIGTNCVIGHNTKIIDSVVENDVDIQSSEIRESRIGSRSKIGPFAYLRPGSSIGEDAKIGDFVEVKNSSVGNGSKVSHLTYIGDSDVGSGVNLGCGVVFVNYDGTNKYRSVVKDGAFIGCNTNLIAPVTVGKSAYVAAGTTITKDVPDGSLCIGRAKDTCIEGWVEKRGLLKKKNK